MANWRRIGVWAILLSVFSVMVEEIQCTSITISPETTEITTVKLLSQDDILEYIFRQDHNEESVSKTESLAYFGRCDGFGDLLKAACLLESNSCRLRCSEFTMRNALDLNNNRCSCDVFCRLFGDCCWDFAKQCQLENAFYEEYLSFSKDIVHIQCHARLRIAILGTRSNDRTEDRLDVNVGVIVAHRNLGLTFWNYEGYKNYIDMIGARFPKQITEGKGKLSVDRVLPLLNDENRLVYFNKSFLANINLSLEAIQSFINGELTLPEEEVMLLDELPRPGSVAIRGCHSEFIVLCTNTEPGAECQSTKYIKLHSFEHVCNFDTARSDLTYAGISNWDVTLSHEYFYFTGFDGLSCHFSKDTHRSIKEEKFEFKIVFSIDNDRSVNVLDSILSKDTEWQSLACSKYESKGRCALVYACGKGEVMEGGSCYVPQNIMIEVVEKKNSNQRHFYEVLNGLRLILTDTNTRGGLVLNEKDAKFEQQIIENNGDTLELVQSEWTLVEYNFNANPPNSDVLPVSDLIINYLTKLNETDPIHWMGLVVCFTLERDEPLNPFLFNLGKTPQPLVSCDAFLSWTGFALPVHFSIERTTTFIASSHLQLFEEVNITANGDDNRVMGNDDGDNDDDGDHDDDDDDGDDHDNNSAMLVEWKWGVLGTCMLLSAHILCQ